MRITIISCRNGVFDRSGAAIAIAMSLLPSFLQDHRVTTRLPNTTMQPRGTHAAARRMRFILRDGA